MSVIRTRLLAPRRAFSFKCGGVELIPQPPIGNPGTVDAKNGPQPQTCILTQLTNTMFLLSWRVTAHYWENNGVSVNPVTNLPGAVALYNRWSEQQSIDKRNYSRRTRRGKFTIRSDNTEGFIADEVRKQMAILGLPKGWLRESSDYTQSEDGLTVSYVIVDREVFKYPPPPAFTATGTYSESSAYYGAMRYGEVWLRLEGDPDGDHDELCNVAFTVAMEKIRNRGAIQDDQGLLRQIEVCAVSVGMYDNWVEVTVRSMIDQSKHVKRGIGGMGWAPVSDIIFGEQLEPLTATPLSEDFEDPPEYTQRGTGLLLQAAAYYDPSLRDNAMDPEEGQMQRGREIGTAGRIREP